MCIQSSIDEYTWDTFFSLSVFLNYKDTEMKIYDTHIFKFLIFFQRHIRGTNKVLFVPMF